MDRTSEIHSQFEAGDLLDSIPSELPLSELALSLATFGTAEVILA